MKIIFQLEVMIKSAMNPTLEFLMIFLPLLSLSFSFALCTCARVRVCARVWRNRSDELMKGNLVRFLITGNYTNTSEMPPSKCMSHVGRIITVI